MIKKIIFSIMCLFPFVSYGAPVVHNPGAGTGLTLSDITIGATDDTITVISGNGIRLTPGGINLSDSDSNMYIGSPAGGSLTGQLYITDGIDSSFTILSDGAISVGGRLDIASGKTVSISTGLIPANAQNITFGSIVNNGILNILNAASLTTGNITSSGDLTMFGDMINAGTIINNSGDMNLESGAVFFIDDFINNGTGTSTITGLNILFDNIQNNASGTVIFNSDGAMTSSNSNGIIQNNNGTMNITAGGLLTDGTMANDSGTMNLTLSGLSVMGGSALNASFVNKGNLSAVVTGATNLEYGFDLTTMGTTNTFSLKTGTLTFGAGTDSGLYSNNLNSFKLNITAGGINTGNITNGVGAIVGIPTLNIHANSNANMDIIVKDSVVAGMIRNSGSVLSIKTTDSASAITAAGIDGAVGSTTKIISAGGLNINGIGVVSNAGVMVLNGNTVNVGGVSNSGVGSDLKISSLTDTTGVITIGSLINTLGLANINARQISITGTLINNSGTTTIKGSDSGGGAVNIGSINSIGGAINLDALIGTISVGGSVDASNGAINFGTATNNLIANSSINVKNITVNAGGGTGGGNMNIASGGAGAFKMESTGGNITINGNITNNSSRKIILDSTLINVNGSVVVGGTGTVVFGDGRATKLDILGNLLNNSVGTNVGTVDMNVATVEVGTLSGTGKFIMRGHTLTSVDAYGLNAIDIQNGIWFDGASDPTKGFVVLGTNTLTLQTTAGISDISIAGGISLGAGKTLAINSADMLNVSGLINTLGTLDIDSVNATTFANQITNTGTMTVDGKTIATADIINNSGSVIMTATGAGTGGNITTGAITNTGAGSVMTVNAGTAGTVSASAISSSAGGMDITGDSLSGTLISITGGYANLNTDLITATGAITTSGNLTQGGTSGMLNLTQNNTVLNADSLTIDGDFNAVANSAEYNIINAFKVIGNMTIASGAVTNISAESISSADVENIGTLDLFANDITLSDVINSGTMDINSGTVNSLTVNSFTTTGGTATITGTGMNSAGAIDLFGKLLQNAPNALGTGDLNIVSSDYEIFATSLSATGITQTSGKMVINTSDINIAGDINASDLEFKIHNNTNLTAAISGDVSGGTKFIGLEHMTVGGNYTFNDNSIIMANILDRDTTPYNYWATVSLNNDATLGDITNGANAEPLISINGKFISDISGANPNIYSGWDKSTAGQILPGQIGVNITDVVDMGTAIWLVHADDGIEEQGTETRNAVVRFCNNDGSLCYNYLDSLGNTSTNADGLPVYLTLRDIDGDGIPDSIYMVFDPQFGGPVEVFKIQPIVGAEPNSTDGEYATAGALDNMIAGKLKDTGFFNRTPIELIPLIFKDTNMDVAANELYLRMEEYVLNLDGNALARFSRLFQPRELEQVAGNIALNEHTTFRDFEDRMFDEFIWNRHRNLKKAWLDIDMGMFTQNLSDDKKTDGNRFSITGGFDWAKSNTLILGLTAHASNMSSTNFDTMDLGYKVGESIAGRVDLDISTTNIGVGGYLMKTLSDESRVYGNVFLDLNLIDITREQNFMGTIEGSGTSISMISEWGFLHDILNQYFVGNLYARAGYNFGFSITETSRGADYMDMESSGYFILTPGYSLTAQKKLYTSPWFQIRPYVSVGAEYDVLGAPDSTKFKFSSATEFTDYNYEISPLWMNAGAGVEMLSMSGIQFGLDYRYQHNADIQMHKIKLSGSYRF